MINKEQISKEQMLEFALAVKDEQVFGAWMEKNREDLRAHIMNLVEAAGNAGMQMGLQQAVLELAKAGLGGGIDVTDAEDIPPMPDVQPNGTLH